jgi:hypothetical protein
MAPSRMERTVQIKLPLIFPALILAGCHSEPRPPQSVEQPRMFEQAQPSELPARVGPLGIDLATDATGVLDELKGSQIAFVARYYRDPVSTWPVLSPNEAQKLSSLGLKIVAVWQQNSPDPENLSYSQGYSDAIAAYREAKAVGQPAGSAIYFAVDLNADDLQPVKEYFRGIAAGLAASGNGRAEYRIGVYGSGAVCDAIKKAGLAEYSWLSKATTWAGSLDYKDWNIKQGEALPDFSFDNDSDEARGDYGGFRLGNENIAAPVQGVPDHIGSPRS